MVLARLAVRKLPPLARLLVRSILGPTAAAAYSVPPGLNLSVSEVEDVIHEYDSDASGDFYYSDTVQHHVITLKSFCNPNIFSM